MTLIHYGWPASPYSAKSRAALRVSGLEWSEVRPHGLTFAWLQTHIGRNVIPVLRAEDGHFIQDSSRIIDFIEHRSGRPMIPAHPIARVLALWMEVFADEWMIYPAMYFRWRYRGGDFEYMVRDFGACALPGAPGPLQRKAGRSVADAMNRYLPIMGINEETAPVMEAETLALLDLVAACLDEQPYLLGQRPCIADFALYGPIAAHIGRDPWSAHVIDDRPSIRRWVQALDEGRHAPGSLHFSEPSAAQRALYRRIFEIASPAWCEAEVCARSQWKGPGTTLRRRVGEFVAALGCGEGVVAHRHKLTAVTVWKMQRPIAALNDLAHEPRQRARELLRELGATELEHLHPLDGYTLESIAWKKDKTSFGGLGRVIEGLSGLMSTLAPRGLVHAKERGPVEGLG